MGMKEWAERNKAGGAVQLAKKAERVATREGLKADFAATKAEFAANNAAVKADRGESFQGVVLAGGEVRFKGEGGSVAGVTATVESGADVRRRVTATRFLLAGGVFSKRKQVGHVFLSVVGPGFEFVVGVPVRLEADARVFAARVNSVAGRTF